MFVFITKEAPRGRQALFSRWMMTATEVGKIIPLSIGLPLQAYHKKPYIHDVSNILWARLFNHQQPGMYHRHIPAKRQRFKQE